MNAMKIFRWFVTCVREPQELQTEEIYGVEYAHSAVHAYDAIVSVSAGEKFM